jgi:hypothetical protein
MANNDIRTSFDQHAPFLTLLTPMWYSGLHDAGIRSSTVDSCTYITRIGPRRRVSSSALLDGKILSLGAPIPPIEASLSTNDGSCEMILVQVSVSKRLRSCYFPWSMSRRERDSHLSVELSRTGPGAVIVMYTTFE